MTRALLLCATALGVVPLGVGAASAQSLTVPFFHNTADHAGVFTVPGLTAQTAGGTALDAGFSGAVSGVVNATPLYWHPAGASSGTVIVATENNVVAALNETTGAAVWSTTLGPAATADSGCGNINPIGVTGTPVIDAASGTLYVDAYVESAGAPKNELFALSLATGAILPNWPVAVGAGVRAKGQAFSDKIEEQRGALALLNGSVYIPFGGYDGDCGNYHGIVAGVTTQTPAVAQSWSTAAEKGGIWAPGGIVTDGTSLFFSTGNTAQTKGWSGGEALVRITPGLQPVIDPSSYFSPVNWKTLDQDDQDLGGTGPTLITLAGATPASLALALGKDGNAYLLNAANLGGISTALQTLTVSSSAIRSATARYANGSSVMIVVNAHGSNCSGGGRSNGVLALSVSAVGGAPKIAPAWCAALNGGGAPVVTTSDGVHDPIVWLTGAQGDGALHAYDGVSGAAVYTSPAAPATIEHFSSLLVANGHVYVPAANAVLAYKLGQ